MVRCAHLLMTRWVSMSVVLQRLEEPHAEDGAGRSGHADDQASHCNPSMSAQHIIGDDGIPPSPRLIVDFGPPRQAEQMAEFLHAPARLLLRGRGVDLRELVAPVERPAGVDDGAAVGEIAYRLALGLDARIERRRPGLADDLDRGRGVRTREQRPHHLLADSDTSMSSSTTIV